MAAPKNSRLKSLLVKLMICVLTCNDIEQNLRVTQKITDRIMIACIKHIPCNNTVYTRQHLVCITVTIICTIRSLNKLKQFENKCTIYCSYRLGAI